MCVQAFRLLLRLAIVYFAEVSVVEQFCLSIVVLGLLLVDQFTSTRKISLKPVTYISTLDLRRDEKTFGQLWQSSQQPCLCKKTLLRRRIPLRQISPKNTKSGVGEEFMLLCRRAKAHRKGDCFFIDTGMNGTGRYRTCCLSIHNHSEDDFICCMCDEEATRVWHVPNVFSGQPFLTFPLLLAVFPNFRKPLGDVIMALVCLHMFYLHVHYYHYHHYYHPLRISTNNKIPWFPYLTLK